MEGHSQLTSSKSSEWATPQWLFDVLNKECGPFNLDAAATKKNAKCKKFFTKADDGLAQDWKGKTFVNPPYGRNVTGKWVAKAAEEACKKPGRTVVMLLPARTDTTWWHDVIATRARAIMFIRARVKFGGADAGATFPSAVVVFQYPGTECSPDVLHVDWRHFVPGRRSKLAKKKRKK